MYAYLFAYRFDAQVQLLDQVCVRKLEESSRKQQTMLTPHHFFVLFTVQRRIETRDDPETQITQRRQRPHTVVDADGWHTKSGAVLSSFAATGNGLQKSKSTWAGLDFGHD